MRAIKILGVIILLILIIKVAKNTGTLPNTYSNSQYGFSLRYPQNYKVNENYIYYNSDSNRQIYGIKFTIDPAVATGTNLASDSYISVETIPQVGECTATLFLPTPQNTTATATQEQDANYSFASSTGAGAGNRYEEQVYALNDTNPCLAVRYYIHYGVFENYPTGSIKQFDRRQIISTFDSIRSTLKIVQ